LIGELVTRAYYENQGKPIYTVKTVVQPNRGTLDDKTAAGLLGDVDV